MTDAVPAPGCRTRRFGPALAAFALLVSGCSGDRPQSVLHPESEAAAAAAWLTWMMIAGFSAVFVLVMLLTAYAIFRRRGDARLAPPLGRTGFIVAGGVVLPVVFVLPLLFASLGVSKSLAPPPPDALTVRVVGHMWWWKVSYPASGIVTANEITIPAGQPVRLEMTSADVIHSFWVPRLNGKRDMIPGIETVFWIQADEPGVYRGVCAEYCGAQHANMAFRVVALPPDEFRAWVAAREEPDARPRTPQQAEGQKVFLRAGCAQCHAIRGTPANGQVGPDLTHLGSRLTLGAGRLPNNPGALAGWIANPQAVKPGVRMPPAHLAPADLLALVAYLEGLQ